MLGAGICGAMHRSGRISVIPAGHCSPGLIVVSGPPPRPCAAVVPARVKSSATVSEEMRIEAPLTRTRNLVGGLGGRNGAPRQTLGRVDRFKAWFGSRHRRN